MIDPPAKLDHSFLSHFFDPSVDPNAPAIIEPVKISWPCLAQCKLHGHKRRCWDENREQPEALA